MTGNPSCVKGTKQAQKKLIIKLPNKTKKKKRKKNCLRWILWRKHDKHTTFFLLTNNRFDYIFPTGRVVHRHWPNSTIIALCIRSMWLRWAHTLNRPGREVKRWGSWKSLARSLLYNINLELRISECHHNKNLCKLNSNFKQSTIQCYHDFMHNMQTCYCI